MITDDRRVFRGTDLLFLHTPTRVLPSWTPLIDDMTRVQYGTGGVFRVLGGRTLPKTKMSKVRVWFNQSINLHDDDVVWEPVISIRAQQALTGLSIIFALAITVARKGIRLSYLGLIFMSFRENRIFRVTT